MTDEQKKFIETIGAIVQQVAPIHGIKVCSPIIAQAILESAWGTSRKAKIGQNYFGIKYNPGRLPISDEWFYDIGSEQNANGTYSSGQMKWAKFKCLTDCVIGYFQFLQAPRYANLKGVTDPSVYVERIKADGYATSQTYVLSIMFVIKNYGLMKYDAPAATAAAQPAEQPAVKPAEAPATTPASGKAMRINVHAGHNADGKVACGATGFIKESTEARRVRTEVIAELRAAGCTVYDCTVDDASNELTNLQQIVAKCNAHAVDLDVSIHFNASTGQGHGTEVWIYDPDSKSKPYAQRTVNAIAALGFANRGIKYSKNLFVLRHTNAPAMLVECCFVDSKTDVNIYDPKKTAHAIVQGILQ